MGWKLTAQLARRTQHRSRNRGDTSYSKGKKEPTEKLSSDFHIHAVACMHPQLHTYTQEKLRIKIQSMDVIILFLGFLDVSGSGNYHWIGKILRIYAEARAI